MTTIEKLFVQIFDRKRQIIEHLKHQKQLFDQRLLSKLLIQGIPPPPWLLNSDFHSSSSDLTGLNKQELISGLLLPKPGPSFASYPSGPCFLYDKPITTADSGILEETCAVKCASSNGIDDKDEPGVAPLCHADGLEDMTVVAHPSHVDGTEDMAGIIPPSHVDGTMDTFNYVPMSPEDQMDTRFLHSIKSEQSLARIQRSRSRQKALELRNSAKASTKSRFGMENDVGSSSESKTCRYGEHHDDLRESLELAEPTALPTEICSDKDVTTGNILNKERSDDACGGPLVQSTGSKAKDVRSGDSEKEIYSSAYGVRITRSRSGIQQTADIPSGSQTYRYDKNHDGSSESLKLVEPSRLPIETAFNERSNDACGGSFTCSTVNEAIEVEKGDGQKIEKDGNSYGGIITRSRRSQQSLGRAHLMYIKSNEVCVGQTTKATHGQTQNAEVAVENRNGELENTEAWNQRSRSRKSGPVKPKQLDFDEVEEYNLAYVPNHISGTINQDISEERTTAYAIANSSSNPCAFSTVTPEVPDFEIAHPQSLAYETLEVPDTETVYPSFKHDQICGQTMILPHCLGGSQGTPEYVPGSNAENVVDPCMSHLGTDQETTFSSLTHTFEPEEEQNLSEEPRDHSYLNTDADPTTCCCIDTVKTECLSMEGLCKIRHDSNASPNVEATYVFQLSHGKTLAVSSTPVTEIAPTTRDKVEYAPSVEMMKYRSLSANATIESSSSSQGKEVGGSKLLEPGAKVNMLPDFNFSLGVDGSWPCYKRRKIEYQNLNKSASPTMRANSFYAMNQNIPDISARGEKENIFPASHNWTNSHNSDVALSNVAVLANETDGRVTLPSYINQNSPNEASRGNKENNPLMSQNLTFSPGSVAALSDCAILAKETDRSVTSSPSMEHVLTPQVQYGEDKASLGRDVSSSTWVEQTATSDVSAVNHITLSAPSDSFSKDGIVKITSSSAVSCSNSLVNDQDLVDGTTEVNMMAVDLSKSSQRVHGLKLSIGSPLMECMNVAEADQSIPEFEGFVIGENTVDAPNSGDELVHEEIPFLSNVMDRTSLPEQSCQSVSLSTPVSPFPTACKWYLVPGMYSSIPNGLLENIDLHSNQFPSGRDLLRKSHSDQFSFSGSQHGWDFRKPFQSPVGNSFEGITSKSGGSHKLSSSNLELTCFPILEDPESSEEDVDDAIGIGVKTTELYMNASTNSEPLFDISVQNGSTCSPDHVIESDLESVAEDLNITRPSTRSSSNKEPVSDITVPYGSSLAPDHAVERCSIKSISTKISIHEMHTDGKKSGISRQARSGKENKSFSVGTNSSKKPLKTQSSRFSKPKLSGKSSLRSRGQSLSEKEHKSSNIVSNVKSFLPFVQQNQAASVIPEKRDVKVKALQAAEAAKRVAEKRENERNQKKEAMKLERARVEQENMKEMERKKKLKEEERKKREAENAAKKRQREEEEKKEKERKKRRIEEARLQHKQVEQKLHLWREDARCAAEDERANQRKDSNEIIEKEVDIKDEGDDLGQPVNDSVEVANARIEDVHSTIFDHKMSTGSSTSGKLHSVDMAECSTPNVDKKDKPIDRTSIQQSYDISPYQCSDDEEEEEDEIPNKKFVPTWASKSSVALALSSLQHLNPDVIFPRGSFCSLHEVLLPRRLPQK